MKEERQVYELELIRHRGGGPPWRGWLKLNREEREKLSFRCTQARNAGAILTYTITHIGPISSGELRNALSQDLKEALGFAGPKLLRRTP